MHNAEMGEVNLMDHLKDSHYLGRRSKGCFCLVLFFESIGIASINAFVIYKKLENDSFPLKKVNFS